MSSGQSSQKPLMPDTSLRLGCSSVQYLSKVDYNGGISVSDLAKFTGLYGYIYLRCCTSLDHNGSCRVRCVVRCLTSRHVKNRVCGAAHRDSIPT